MNLPDVSELSDGFALGKSVFDLLRYVKSTAGADVISGYFSPEGTRLVGSEIIEVERDWPDDDVTSPVFYFRVKPVADYVFLRYPVVESCAYELVGTRVGEKRPTAEYWRWIAPVVPGRLYSGSSEAPNLIVPFLVFGYKPKALIQQFSSKT